MRTIYQVVIKEDGRKINFDTESGARDFVALYKEQCNGSGFELKNFNVFLNLADYLKEATTLIGKA